MRDCHWVMTIITVVVPGVTLGTFTWIFSLNPCHTFIYLCFMNNNNSSCLLRACSVSGTNFTASHGLTHSVLTVAFCSRCDGPQVTDAETEARELHQVVQGYVLTPWQRRISDPLHFNSGPMLVPDFTILVKLECFASRRLELICVFE